MKNFNILSITNYSYLLNDINFLYKIKNRCRDIEYDRLTPRTAYIEYTFLRVVDVGNKILLLIVSFSSHLILIISVASDIETFYDILNNFIFDGYGILIIYNQKKLCDIYIFEENQNVNEKKTSCK